MSFKKQIIPQLLHLLLGASIAAGGFLDERAWSFAFVAGAIVVAVAIQVIGRVVKEKPILNGDSRDVQVTAIGAVVCVAIALVFTAVAVASGTPAIRVTAMIMAGASVASMREVLQFPVTRVLDMVLDLVVTVSGTAITAVVAEAIR